MQIFQLGAGVLHRGLLLLEGADVALEPVELLDLLAQPGELRLGLGERAGEAAVHPGIEGK